MSTNSPSAPLPDEDSVTSPVAANLNSALSQQELNTLATYNAEISRGLMHQDWWRRDMKALQDRFDAGGWRRG